MTNKPKWQCPYCGIGQVLSEGENLHIHSELKAFVKESEHGDIGVQIISISCLNKDCKKLTLTVDLKKAWPMPVIGHHYGKPYLDRKSIQSWRLLPDSVAKPQPDYIPASIKKDYEEACKIAHLSPNASAVLSRRCLQSMIRDFCKIKRKTLYAEITELEANVKDRKIPGVTEESIQSIDSIRKMGNIGSHMEKPTGILIDIEPDEATLLIQLIETLFKDWYVARYERQQRLKKIQDITIQKEQLKNTESRRENTKTTH